MRRTNYMKIEKDEVRRFIQVTYALLIIGLLGLVLMALVFMLPTGRIRRHVEQSMLMLASETDYFSVTPGIPGSQLDNYTEAAYINQALVNWKDASLFSCILSGNYYQTSDQDVLPVENLLQVVNHDDDCELIPRYCRFFNGYEVVVKPLFIITNYAGIRQINLFLIFFLSVLLCVEMVKKGMKKYVLSAIISFLFINPFSIALSMTFSGFYYCMIIPCLYILMADKEKVKKYGWLLFEITGACAFYFNMNYFQLLTFGIPLLYYYLVIGIPDKPAKLLKDILLLFAPWCIGYAGMMVFKWAVYALLIDHNMFMEMYEKIVFRTGTIDGSRWSGLRVNLTRSLKNPWWDIIECVFVLYCLRNQITSVISKASKFIAGRLKKKVDRSKPGLKTMAKAASFKLWVKEQMTSGTLFSEIILVAVFAIFPICRCLIFSNHVYIHNAFTYRLFMMPIMALNLFIAKVGSKNGVVIR